MTMTTGFDPVLVEWLEQTVLRAPRLVQRAPWELRCTDGELALVASSGEVRVDQPACVSYGMAVEFLVTALHERGMSAHVATGPTADDPVLARIEPLPSVVPSKIDHALFTALDGTRWPPLLELPGSGCAPTAYQRDVLGLAAAALRTTIVWDVPITPDATRAAIVTAADGPDDWFRAGRGTAHVMLRARTLGLRTALVTPSLRHQAVREAIRGWLRPVAYPQVLVQVFQRTG